MVLDSVFTHFAALPAATRESWEVERPYARADSAACAEPGADRA
jgi:hypothetical protein